MNEIFSYFRIAKLAELAKDNEKIARDSEG